MDSKGNVISHSFPGGYPLFYTTASSEILCAACVQENPSITRDHDHPSYVDGCRVNWATRVTCDMCSKTIDSAYEEPEDEDA